MIEPGSRSPSSKSPWLVVGIVLGVVFLFGACIIGVLAAIAVPNFLEAQSRARVSRTRADLRSLATAIETYKVDCNAYPAWTTDPGKSINASLGVTDNVPTFLAPVRGLQTLTTPIAYMTAYFPDVFAQQKGRTFAYYAVGGKRFALWGCGPDEDYDFDYKILDAESTDEEVFKAILKASYDPTNGTISDGDIIRSSVSAY